MENSITTEWRSTKIGIAAQLFRIGGLMQSTLHQPNKINAIYTDPTSMQRVDIHSLVSKLGIPCLQYCGWGALQSSLYIKTESPEWASDLHSDCSEEDFINSLLQKHLHLFIKNAKMLWGALCEIEGYHVHHAMVACIIADSAASTE